MVTADYELPKFKNIGNNIITGNMSEKMFVELDKFGRVVIPKEIREEVNCDKFEVVYDRKNKDVHLFPVRDIREWKGKAKGILKDYLKEHEEDWNDPYRR